MKECCKSLDDGLDKIVGILKMIKILDIKNNF